MKIKSSILSRVIHPAAFGSVGNDNHTKDNTKISTILLVAVTGILCVGCAGLNGSEPTAKVDNSLAQQMGPYSGPKATVAMAKFEWKIGGGKGGSIRIDSPQGVHTISVTREDNYLHGLGDMLTTALVQCDRFKVMERQDFDATTRKEVGLSDEGWTSQETKKERGHVKAADLQIVAAVTGWEPNASGKKVKGIGAGLVPNVPIIGGGGIDFSKKKAKATMDIRIIDTETSEVLAATRVVGEATDSKVSLAGIGIGHGGVIAGGLSEYQNTPMEEAIRVMINEATKFIAQKTPAKYFKHSGDTVVAEHH